MRRAHECDANNDTWTVGHIYSGLHLITESGEYEKLKAEADVLKETLPPSLVNHLALEAFRLHGPLPTPIVL